MKKKTSVLLVSPKPPPRGGIATWTELVLKELREEKEVDVVHVDIAPHWKKIYTQGYLLRAIGGVIQGLKDIGKIEAETRKREYDAASLTTSGSMAFIRDVLFVWLLRRRGMRVYYHLRFGRVPEMEKKKDWEWLLMKMAAKNATEIIVLENRTKETLEKDERLTIRKIPNCVKLVEKQRKEKNSEDVEILYIGWMIKNKGVEELVKAWSEMEERNVKLCMIGPGDERYIEKVKNVAREKGRERELEIAGEMEHKEAMKRLKETDIFVLPSYTEGFPNTIIEAMNYGKAIVATEVGAIKEMLNDGGKKCGIVVEKKNVEELKTALKLLINDRKYMEEIGRKAREKVEEQYSTEKVLKKLVEMWAGNIDEQKAMENEK